MRSSVIRTVAVILLLSMLLTVTAFAEDATISGSDVNFRSGPGTEYSVIGCFAYGTSVTLLDRSNSSWYKISYNGQEGYVYSSYVKTSGSSAVIENNTSSAAETQTTTDTASTVSGGQAGYINAMYVRFRSGPSGDSAILGEYNTGTQLTVISQLDSGWDCVNINGTTGYVYCAFIALGTYGSSTGSSSAGSSTSAASSVQPVATTDSSASSAAQSTGTQTQTTQKTGYINANYVCFRSGPSTAYTVLATYNKNQALTITGSSGSWVACTINGQSGYVYGQYVTENTAAASASTSSGTQTTTASTSQTTTASTSQTTTASSQTNGYITGNSVRFRSGPSTSYDILGEYNYGQTLVITGSTNGWTACTINGVSGYVYSSYVASGSSGSTSGTASSGSGSTDTSGLSSSEIGARAAALAQSFVGYKYVWGGADPSGFDCSGLVQYVYGQLGITLKRVACDQATEGVAVDYSDIQPGDILCFYSGSNYIGHVGIYIGNNMFVHASTSTTGVIVSTLSGYYQERGFIIRRVA